MKRKIIDNIAATCKAVKMDGFADEPAKWLSQHMHIYKLKYLLAHDDCGVIWGRLDSQELITSHDLAPEYSPPLRLETLQMARLFARTGELLVWRNDDGAWVGRLIADDTLGTTPEWTAAFDEQQILVGTKAVPLNKGFYLMSEGSQGLFHAVPLYPGEIDEQNRTLRLVVRHYLQSDEYGFTRVNASRLFSLLPEPKESNA